MSSYELTSLGLQDGVWQALITGPSGPPEIQVTHLGAEIPGVSLVPASAQEGWILQVPVPVETLADGVQTYLVEDRTSATPLGSFSIRMGEALGDDLLAEVKLLREELDMLKRVFRRQLSGRD